MRAFREFSKVPLGSPCVPFGLPPAPSTSVARSKRPWTPRSCWARWWGPGPPSSLRNSPDQRPRSSRPCGRSTPQRNGSWEVSSGPCDRNDLSRRGSPTGPPLGSFWMRWKPTATVDYGASTSLPRPATLRGNPPQPTGGVRRAPRTRSCRGLSSSDPTAPTPGRVPARQRPQLSLADVRVSRGVVGSGTGRLALVRRHRRFVRVPRFRCALRTPTVGSRGAAETLRRSPQAGRSGGQPALSAESSNLLKDVFARWTTPRPTHQ